MVDLVLFKDREHAGRRFMAGLARRDRRGGYEHTVAKEQQTLRVKVHDDQSRAGRRPLGFPYMLSRLQLPGDGQQLASIELDLLGEGASGKQQRDREWCERFWLHCPTMFDI